MTQIHHKIGIYKKRQEWQLWHTKEYYFSILFWVDRTYIS